MNMLISLCMIVKNEEEVLERCLQSVQGLVDEIIIMDTGSTDGTVNIAKKFTDNIFHFEWINDFSAARNAGIKHASGKWILVLDADEYVQDEDKQILKEYLLSLDTSKTQGIALPVYNILGGGKIVQSSGIRIFLNEQDIGYTNAIHEQVIRINGTFHYEKYTFAIYHTGYIPEVVKNKDKSNRNMLILQNIQTNKTLTPYENFTLANEYMAKKDYPKAVELYKQAFYSVPKTEEWAAHCASKLAQSLIELRYYNEGLLLLEQCIQFWGKYPDFYSIRGTLFISLGLREQAINDFKKSIEIATTYGNQQFWLISPDLGFSIPYLYLSDIFEKQFDIKQTVFYLTKYININRRDAVSLGRLIKIVINYENSHSAMELLGKLYSTQNKDDLQHLFYMSTIIGNLEFSEHYYRLCQQEHVNISSPYLIRFALITANQELFNNELNKVITANQLNNQMNYLIYVASCIWEEETYLTYLTNHETSFSENLNRILHAFFKATETDISLYSEDLSILRILLSDLFRMKFFNTYDWLINKFSAYNAELANLMANEFYNDHEFQLAIDYYTLLIKNDSLNAQSYENLGNLYISQGDIEEGLSFLKRAIDIEPNKYNIYTTIICNSQSEKDKAAYASFLEKRLPQALNIRFLMQKVSEN